MPDWTATARHGVTRKRNTKRLKDTENLFRKNLQLTWCRLILHLKSYTKTRTTVPPDGFLHLRETSLDTRWEVEHFKLFFVFLVPGLVDIGWESLNFGMPQILKKRCNFNLRWFLDLGNTSLGQNLRLKTLDYLLFIPATF